MIEVEPNTALVLYLGFALFIILGIWISRHFKVRKKKIFCPEQQLYVCEYCHFAYLSESHKPVTQCPQCQSFNKSNAFKS
jgi:ribosomal protein L37AE/L43A